MERKNLYFIGGVGHFSEDSVTEEEIILWKFFDEMYENNRNVWIKLHDLCCDCVPTYRSKRYFTEIAEAYFNLSAYCEEIYVPGLDVYLSEIDIYEIFRFIESETYDDYLENK